MPKNEAMTAQHHVRHAGKKITKRARLVSNRDSKPAAAPTQEKKPARATPQAQAKPTQATKKTMEQASKQFNPQKFAENMGKASELWQQIMAVIKYPALSSSPHFSIDPLHLQEAWGQAIAGMMANPGGWIEASMAMWQDYTNFWQHTAQRMLGNTDNPYIQPDMRDRRFKGEEWQENLFYDYVKESYLLANKWMQKGLQITEIRDSHTNHKLNFFARQFMDALSPSNYLFTNPLAMKELLESNGDNLVQGLQFLLEDIEKGHGNLRIRMTDESAFEVGKNLACTKGSVVYKNDLIELIQYAPQTETVHKRPLLVMPAWINKYYILDLQQKNSLVRWLVEQGHTVFMISWVNPDESLSDKSFSDYLREGPLAALDAIEKATGERSINTMGYCLGGTLLSIALSYLKSKGEEDRIASATYLTTLTDYSDVGDIGVFIDDTTIAAIEDRMSTHGYMPAEDMSQTFNMLRSNDLIWSFYINNYLLGKNPFPFDILYWNSDSTRLPMEMNTFYLRNFYQKNLLIKPGGVHVADVPINLRKVETPAYLLSTKDDHIAPWQSSYVTAQMFSGPVQFTLAESGHVAGVVNPPGKDKYGYYANDALPDSPDQWIQEANYTKKSWWTHWQKWVKPYAGNMVKARKPGSKKMPVIEAAPGSYVKRCA